jgi:hypothetical protein
VDKMKPALQQQLRANPHEVVRLIVRTTGKARPHIPWLKSAGFEVTQQFRLTPGVAVSCTGAQALQLPAQAWVLSVEPDAPITTM